MAAKRKIAPAPAAAQSPSSDDDSSSSSDSEQQRVAQRNTPRPQTPKPTERDDDESDSDSGSESDLEPPIKTLKTPPKPSESEDSSEEDEEEEEQEKLKSPAITLKVSQKPSESEDSSEEDEEEKEQEEVKKLKSPVKTLKTSQKPLESEEEEQEQVEKPKSPAKEPESQPDKKKQKLSTPDQSPSKKSSMIQRIWSPEDEMSLLRALSEYQVRNGKLPPKKDYASFLSGISGSIGFPVTEKQLFNKIHHMRFSYSQKKKKGSNINFTQPHEKAVFDLCTKLFEDGNNASKNGASQETNRDAETKRKRKKGITEARSLIVANGGTTTIDNGGVVNGAVANGGDVARSHFYLEGLIKDMISTEKCPRWLSTVEDVVALIGESRAHDLEAKTKMLRIDAIKLRAREEKLMAEFFDILADEMVDD